MSFLALLEAARSPNAAEQKPAEHALHTMEKENLAHYLGELLSILKDENMIADNRRLAGLMLKNVMVSRDKSERKTLQNNWMKLQEEVRNGIKSITIACMSSKEVAVGSIASLVISTIAAFEVPNNMWPNFVFQMCSMVKTTGDENTNLRLASLTALGIFCEEIYLMGFSDGLKAHADDILLAINVGMNAPHMPTRLAGTNALKHSMEFIGDIFEKKGARDTIFNMIFANITVPDDNVRLSAYQCLVTIATSYYPYLEEQIKRIYEFTLNAMSGEKNPIAMQAIEFWTSICDCEILLMECGDDIEITNQKYMARALGIVPKLLTCMTRQESEELDDDDMTPAKAAANCLVVVAGATGDSVVEIVLSFVSSNIQNPDWHFRDAAVLAFGSILAGPDPTYIVTVVQNAFTTVLSLMSDAHPIVRDSAAWTIGRVCDVLPGSINSTIFPNLMEALLKGLHDEFPHIANQVCWSIGSLASAGGSSLTPYFPKLCSDLVICTKRKDVSQGNLMLSAWDALTKLVQSANTADQTISNLITMLLDELLNRISGTVTMQVYSPTQREHCQELLGYVSQCMNAVMSQMNENILLSKANVIVQAFVAVLEYGGEAMNEDAFFALEALISKLGRHFTQYVPIIHPYILKGLASTDNHHLCATCISITGSIGRNLGEDIRNFSDAYMEGLLALSNGNDSALKPTIMGVFGDFASSLGGDFQRYMSHVMPVLLQGARTTLTEDEISDENIDMLNSLRFNICEAFILILQGLRRGNAGSVFLTQANLEVIGSFLHLIATDQYITENVIKSASGFIGDLIDGSQNEPAYPIIKQIVSQQFVRTIIDDASKITDDPTHTEVMNWLRMKLSQV